MVLPHFEKMCGKRYAFHVPNFKEINQPFIHVHLLSTYKVTPMVLYQILSQFVKLLRLTEVNFTISIPLFYYRYTSILVSNSSPGPFTNIEILPKSNQLFLTQNIECASLFSYEFTNLEQNKDLVNVIMSENAFFPNMTSIFSKISLKTLFLVAKIHEIFTKDRNKCYQFQGMVYKCQITKDRNYQYRCLPISRYTCTLEYRIIVQARFLVLGYFSYLHTLFSTCTIINFLKIPNKKKSKIRAFRTN